MLNYWSMVIHKCTTELCHLWLIGYSVPSQRLKWPPPPRTKWPPFRRRYFHMHFREWKFCSLLKCHRRKFVPKGPVDNRWAIVWTNADPIHWRIYASPGGDELTIYCTLSNLSKSRCNQNTKIFIHENTFGNVVYKMPANFANHQRVNMYNWIKMFGTPIEYRHIDILKLLEKH